MNALEISGVSFSYDSDGKVLDNVNLTVREGEYVCLLGKNGSGKSTLARLINGLLQPSEGSVKVFGMDTGEKSLLYEIRKTAGMVFQNPDNQMVASIVEDDLAFGPENIGVPREEIGERIDYALGAVGMEKFRLSTPTRLSGGQKQRIAIAGVLALKPKILILDESTSMLDPRGRKEVMDVVSRLNREEGMTVINITHYMDETKGCDRAVVLDKGTVAFDKSARDLFSSDPERFGLGKTKAAYIAQKLSLLGVPIGEVITEEELKDKLCALFAKI